MNEPAKRVNLSAIFESYSRTLTETFRKTEETLELAVDRGEGREAALRDFLKQSLPKRYGVGTGFVINSAGKQSKQIDIVIYDAQRCPVFSLDIDPKHNAYPVECVYGMIEVKSTLTPGAFDDAWNNALALKKVARGNIAAKQSHASQQHIPLAQVVPATRNGTHGKNWRTQLATPMAACFAYKVQEDWGRSDGAKWQMTAIERLNAYDDGYSLDVICVHEEGVLAKMFAENVRGRGPMTQPEWNLMTSHMFSAFTLFYVGLLNLLSCRAPENINMMDYLKIIMKDAKILPDK